MNDADVESSLAYLDDAVDDLTEAISGITKPKTSPLVYVALAAGVLGVGIGVLSMGMTKKLIEGMAQELVNYINQKTSVIAPPEQERVVPNVQTEVAPSSVIDPNIAVIGNDEKPEWVEQRLAGVDWASLLEEPVEKEG